MRKKNSRLKLSIIVPVYNEEGTLKPLLKKVLSAHALGLEKEILIVDDGSTDKTPGFLEQMRERNLKVFHHGWNRGKGAAIQTALDHASGNFVLIQDADLEYDPVDYEKLLLPLLKGKAEVVYGSRFMRPRSPFGLWHWIGNKALNLAANFLYGTNLSDMETGYKAFKAEVLREIKLQAPGFDFDPEVTAKVVRKGHKILEVPVSYKPRGYAQGKKITWWDGVIALICLLKCRILAWRPR